MSTYNKRKNLVGRNNNRPSFFLANEFYKTVILSMNKTMYKAIYKNDFLSNSKVMALKNSVYEHKLVLILRYCPFRFHAKCRMS